MAKLGPPPTQGEDIAVLWRYVAELYAKVRALENMRLAGSIPNIPTPVQGHLQVGDSDSVITFS